MDTKIIREKQWYSTSEAYFTIKTNMLILWIIHRAFFMHIKKRDLLHWTVLSFLQSVNGLSHFKMKLWKCAAIILMLCGAALSVIFSRNLLFSKAHALPHFEHSTSLLSASASASSSASSMSSNNSSSGTRGTIRRVRSADGDNSVISDCKLPSFFFQYAIHL